MERIALAGLTSFLLGAGCSQGGLPTNVTPAQAQRALAIADEYESWGRVDDELRWAPFLCRQPMPGIARQSASMDDGTHGQKLYSVFAKDHAGYPERSKVGQMIVKQSWKAEAVSAPEYDAWELQDFEAADHFYPYAKKGEQYYKATEPAGLFIMYRVEDGAADSDEGWVYATVSADRKVTASGRIASCMGCHVEAPHGRLFGVPTSIEYGPGSP